MHVTTVPMSLTFLTGQVGYMKARGLAVRAVSSPGEELSSFADREGVPTDAVQMSRTISPLADLVALVKLAGKLRAWRPHIVHAHTPKGGLLGMLAAWLIRVPVRVYHIRGLPFVTASGMRRRLLRWTEIVSCRLAHQVLCVSSSVHDVAVADGLCPPGKIKVFSSGNGVDSRRRFNPHMLEPGARAAARERFSIPVDALVIGFVGRIVRDKGIVELAGAWRQLREEVPNLHLLLVGPTEPRDPVPPEVLRALQADPRVHLAGADWNTPPLYAAMDLVVLPSYREGFPNVPLEAAAMGLSVVTTNVPGCVDAVRDGETGLLVKPQDTASLTDAIRLYLREPELRRRHGAAGRERVLVEFRQEVIWEALYQEYRRLLAAVKL
jgi:glycosyltransferase involved in cell wall biosynthesis